MNGESEEKIQQEVLEHGLVEGGGDRSLGGKGANNWRMKKMNNWWIYWWSFDIEEFLVIMIARTGPEFLFSGSDQFGKNLRIAGFELTDPNSEPTHWTKSSRSWKRTRIPDHQTGPELLSRYFGPFDSINAVEFKIDWKLGLRTGFEFLIHQRFPDRPTIIFWSRFPPLLGPIRRLRVRDSDDVSQTTGPSPRRFRPW